MGYLIFLALLLIIFLDIKKKVNITNRFFMGIILLVNPHFFLIIYYMLLKDVSGIYFWTAILFFAYTFFKVMIAPNSSRQVPSKRLFVMEGGRRLIMYSFYGQAVQLAFYISIIHKYGWENRAYMFIDIIFVVIYMWFLAVNGIIRIICTSKWLSVIKRVVCIFGVQLPVINMFVMMYLVNTAYHEYEYESYKRENKEITQTSHSCSTKYPIVLIHGVGFRDLRYFNYWGRIPTELTKLGAKIYYGNQQAWGTIEQNAGDIRRKIYDIIETTGCKKVNIIAHSKGGLDSRYAISCLGMDKYVASLTTVSTPHGGVKMADILIKYMPKWMFDMICFFVNKFFSGMGDSDPDFATVAKSFTVKETQEFNKKVTDKEGVYYQSYTSLLKNVFSDYILLIPYIFIRLTDGKNDGLVTEESAHWGNFRGVFLNKYRRGISHGDMIDLKREDYRGFDVVETYVGIVKELKDMGF